MDFIEYITTEGERWDTIAYRCYGDPYAYPRIIELNPDYRANATLPGGVTLRVEIIDQPPAVLAPETALPPWRR